MKPLFLYLIMHQFETCFLSLALQRTEILYLSSTYLHDNYISIYLTKPEIGFSIIPKIFPLVLCIICLLQYIMKFQPRFITWPQTSDVQTKSSLSLHWICLEQDKTDKTYLSYSIGLIDGDWPITDHNGQKEM